MWKTLQSRGAGGGGGWLNFHSNHYVRKLIFMGSCCYMCVTLHCIKVLLFVNVAQTLANQGPNSTFVNEASCTWSSPKPSSSWVIKLIDGTQVTHPQGEFQFTSILIIAHFRVVRQVITHVLYHFWYKSWGEYINFQLTWIPLKPSFDHLFATYLYTCYWQVGKFLINILLS